MSPDAKKLLKTPGIILLVLVNFVVILGTAMSIKIIYESFNNPAYYCGSLVIGGGCAKPDTPWNIIFFFLLYMLAILASLIIALKRGPRAWWYNILVLVTGPLAFFLLILVENYVS